jgi:folate-binding Fe-S cluster repair protein YgfZ
MDRYVMFEDRGFVAIGGDDRSSFLQGLIGGDVARVSPGRAVHAALPAALATTPAAEPGRAAPDFFIVDQGDRLLLDCERTRAGDLRKRLSLARGRAKLALADVSHDYRVAACFGPTILEKLEIGAPGEARDYAGGIAYVDPRLAALGARIVLHAGLGEDPLIALGCVRAEPEDYHAHRIAVSAMAGIRRRA